jgi:hypothetical protein
MISNDRIFKRGDVIVSGYGNIRILTGERFSGSSVPEDSEDVFYCGLTMYCESDAPAGTDMRFARHATEKEKKIFFDTLKANGLVYDAKTCTIKAGKNYKGVETENVQARKNTKGPQPYKVVKKRVRPTLTQMRDLESGLENEHKLHIHFSKEAGRLKAVADELEIKVKAGLEQINKLTSENRTLQQSNTLMKEELARQKKANIELSKFNDQYKEELAALRGRGFWARVFNR